MSKYIGQVVDDGGTEYLFRWAFHKFDATGAPGAGNDETQEYKVGSLWVDVTGDLSYVCVDHSTGAAVWQALGSAGGGGTVTTVSVVTANGVSGSVANATTTPAITLTLGNIVPTTVNKVTITAPATGSTLTIDDGFTVHATGNVTALSGSSMGANTGDETAAGILTKLLTVDGAGSGLDADLLDGMSSAAFAPAASAASRRFLFALMGV